MCVPYLSFLYQIEDYFALSKDIDVVFLLDSRPFHQHPPVMNAINFVIVKNKLQTEFNSFKKKEVDHTLKYIEVNSLEEFYLQQKSHLLTGITTKFGKTY